MPVKQGSDAQGPYYTKGKGYPKYHYPAYSKGLKAAARARAMKSTKSAKPAAKPMRRRRPAAKRGGRLVNRPMLLRRLMGMGAAVQ